MENYDSGQDKISLRDHNDRNGSLPYIQTASHESSENTSDVALSNSFNDLHLSPYPIDGLSIHSASNPRPPSDGSDSIRLAYDDRRDSAESSKGELTFPPQSETFGAFGPDPYADPQQHNHQSQHQHQHSYDEYEQHPSLPYLAGDITASHPNIPPGVNSQGAPLSYHQQPSSEQWPPGSSEQWLPPGAVPNGAPGQPLPPQHMAHMYRPMPPGATPMYPPQQQQFDQFGNPQQFYPVGPGFPPGAPPFSPQGGLYPPGMPMHPPGIARAMSSSSSLGALSHSPSRMAPPPSRKGTTMTKRKPQQPRQMVSKEAIDEYRERIKDDEDPEAQFNFAKYLIEAARTLQRPVTKSTSSEEKTLKKYRDALLAEALKRIKRLATQGIAPGKPPYADAQFYLANCQGHGSLGLQIDHEKAYSFYFQASKQNHAAATYRVAVCNEIGTGTRRDAARAVWFYRKAAALGDTAGMYKLATILLNGYLGQPKNPKEAVLWLRRAASQADEENPDSLYYLGLLHEKPVQGSGLPHDEAQAFELYTQAAQLGYAPAQHKLGMCYEYGSLTCQTDPRRSIAWYSKAAEKGNAESELALSGWYLTGSEGVLQQSDKEAYLWARKAAKKAVPKAEYAVGYYYEVGIGTPADLAEAVRWYKRASSQGNKKAMQRLTELKTLGDKKNKKKDLARPSRQQAKEECVIV